MKKSLLGLGLTAIIITFALLAPRKVNSMQHVKYGVCHNGVSLCLPAPAFEAHMREHDPKGNFRCFVIPNCESNQESKGRSKCDCGPAIPSALPD